MLWCFLVHKKLRDQVILWILKKHYWFWRVILQSWLIWVLHVVFSHKNSFAWKSEKISESSRSQQSIWVQIIIFFFRRTIRNGSLTTSNRSEIDSWKNPNISWHLILLVWFFPTHLILNLRFSHDVDSPKYFHHGDKWPKKIFSITKLFEINYRKKFAWWKMGR